MAIATWCYSVAFKRPRSTTLKWVLTEKQDVVAASKAAQAFMKEKYPKEHWIEYGVTKTAYRTFYPKRSEPWSQECLPSEIGKDGQPW